MRGDQHLRMKYHISAAYELNLYVFAQRLTMIKVLTGLNAIWCI